MCRGQMLSNRHNGDPPHPPTHIWRAHIQVQQPQGGALGPGVCGLLGGQDMGVHKRCCRKAGGVYMLWYWGRPRDSEGQVGPQEGCTPPPYLGTPCQHLGTCSCIAHHLPPMLCFATPSSPGNGGAQNYDATRLDIAGGGGGAGGYGAIGGRGGSGNPATGGTFPFGGGEDQFGGGGSGGGFDSSATEGEGTGCQGCAGGGGGTGGWAQGSSGLHDASEAVLSGVWYAVWHMPHSVQTACHRPCMLLLDRRCKDARVNVACDTWEALHWAPCPLVTI